MSVKVTITDVIKQIKKIDLTGFYMIKVADDISGVEMLELTNAMKEYKIKGLIVPQRIDFKEMAIDELIDFRNKLGEIIKEFEPQLSAIYELDEDAIIKMVNEEE